MIGKMLQQIRNLQKKFNKMFRKMCRPFKYRFWVLGKCISVLQYA